MLHPYRQGFVLPYDEDSCHEFKGHRNLAVEELPRWAFVPGTRRRSRAPVSRALNAFLNTGKGGTVYLGVTDDGVVKGLYLSQPQIEHVRVSLADLFSRYTPRVTKSRYRVDFFPVKNSSPETLETDDSDYCSSSDISIDSSPPPKQLRAHILRTSTYCWCDKATLALYNQGIEMPTYVIEITILPFKPNPTAHEDTLQLHPIYQNEEGRCYYRRTASNKMLSYQDMAQMTQLEARNHFEKLLQRQRSILSTYQNLYTSIILQQSAHKPAEVRHK